MPSRPKSLLPIQNRFRPALLDRVRIRRLISHCLDKEKVPTQRGVGVVFSGDRLMRRLNREHRNKDRTTDVLSYPFDEGLPLPSEVADEECDILGEIVISLPQCHRQALERDEDPGRELVRLLVHGVLHVLGYDHQNREDRSVMLPRERRYRRWAGDNGLGPGIWSFNSESRRR